MNQTLSLESKSFVPAVPKDVLPVGSDQGAVEPGKSSLHSAILRLSCPTEPPIFASDDDIKVGMVIQGFGGFDETMMQKLGLSAIHVNLNDPDRINNFGAAANSLVAQSELGNPDGKIRRLIWHPLGIMKVQKGEFWACAMTSFKEDRIPNDEQRECLINADRFFETRKPSWILPKIFKFDKEANQVKVGKKVVRNISSYHRAPDLSCCFV